MCDQLCIRLQGSHDIKCHLVVVGPEFLWAVVAQTHNVNLCGCVSWAGLGTDHLVTVIHDIGLQKLITECAPGCNGCVRLLSPQQVAGKAVLCRLIAKVNSKLKPVDVHGAHLDLLPCHHGSVPRTSWQRAMCRCCGTTVAAAGPLAATQVKPSWPSNCTVYQCKREHQVKLLLPLLRPDSTKDNYCWHKQGLVLTCMPVQCTSGMQDVPAGIS
jgi:hypothetical protein